MKMPLVELVYFSGCPNVDAARDAIRSALTAEGLPPEWHEWDREDPAAPEALRGYGSPTVLVNGRDVESVDNAGKSCRLYAGSDGFRGAPAVATLRAALRQLPDGGAQ